MTFKISFLGVLLEFINAIFKNIFATESLLLLSSLSWDHLNICVIDLGGRKQVLMANSSSTVFFKQSQYQNKDLKTEGLMLNWHLAKKGRIHMSTSFSAIFFRGCKPA